MTHDIAIVGMACRFPGAESPDALWDNLLQGVDGITSVPAGRWNADRLTDEDGLTAGTMRTRMGGFVDDVDAFDAGFFGISALEAEGMDPQQRLMLQVAWHALEDAAMPPSSLSGTNAGVFVGAAPSDYASLAFGSPERLTSTSPTGAAVCMVANRVSQTLNIHGPSLVFDTGCSSSLVAADRACNALRGGEISLALVGGVSLILTPEPSVALSTAWMLSPSGQCRSFDGAADGYVRGEGCGLVVLKRHADALRDGDRIWAVIRGSAINHGGQGPNTTIPNQAGITEAALRAFDSGQVEARDLGYIECHGVAAPAADAIELAALRAALPDAACAVGSVKSNIGHLEWAAGIAALIKTVLCVRHGIIAPNLHFDGFGPDVIPGAFHVATQAESWPAGRPRIAAINSFGLGGANAHMVIQSVQPDVAPADFAATPGRFLLPVSARSEGALTDLLSAYQCRGALDYATCRAAAVGRDHHRYRASLIVEPGAAEAAVLPTVKEPAKSVAPIAMVFTGQGSQHEGMGLNLMTEPAFGEMFGRCNVLLEPLIGCSLSHMLQDGMIHQTRFAQAGIFALQVSLAAQWESWGVRPDLVLGHSVGEIAAAHVCGILSLEDAVNLVAERGRLMGSLPENTGSMLAVFAPEDEVAPLLGADLEIAARNGPSMTVVSGRIEHIEKLSEKLEDDFVSNVPLRVSHAFHSSLMEPICDEFGRFVRGLHPRVGGLPMVSTLTGAPMDQEAPLQAEYWTQQLRGPVRFFEATQQLKDHIVVEIGPGNTLCRFGERCQPELTWIPSILQKDAQAPLTEAVAALYEAGVDVDWQAIYADPAQDLESGSEPGPGLATQLPSYPFRRDRYWLDVTPETDHPIISEPVGERPADTRDIITTGLAAILDRPLDATQGFFEGGLDSLGAVELATRLGQALQRPVPVSMLFDHPTIEQLAMALQGTVPKRSSGDRPVSADSIAVVGWSCRLPGDVASPDELWSLMLDGTNTTRTIPADRLAGLDEDTRSSLSGRRGSFLGQIDAYDPQFFGIAPREARAMDLQHMLLLELAWEAMEDAGLTASDLMDSETGVFVGVIELESQHGTSTSRDRAHTLLGSLGSAAAGRISHVLGLRGPSMAIDTACSSSLVAIHLACQSLRNGECERAFAGGVNLMQDPSTFLALDEAGALSPDGSCKTFDAAADGYGRGEGGGLLTLRRHSDAVAAGERILAVIEGSAVNHDGRAAGFTVPNGRAQEAVIRAALHDAGVQSQDVGYHEAHGTGTALGDPIEVDAIARVHRTQRTSPLLLGSLKTNIGHLEAAAGVAGFIRAALCIDRGHIPPHPILNSLSPHLDLDGMKAHIPTTVTPWPQGSKLAGISSFGMSGTNAHVIIGPAPSRDADTDESTRRYLLPISGGTAREIGVQARQYRDWLAEHPAQLADLCFTASRHRRHGPSRILLTATHAESMIEQLDAFLADGSSIDPEAVDPETIKPDTTAGLIQQWLCQSETINWRDLNPTGRLVSLPPRVWDRQSLRPEPKAAPTAVSRVVDPDEWFHELVWEAVDVTPVEQDQRWFIAVDIAHDATELIARLRARNIEAVPVPPESDLPAEATVIVWMRQASWAFGPLLVAARHTDTLIIVTQRGVCVHGQDVDPLAAALWGFGRSLANERPGRCRLLDVDAAVDANAVAEALCSATAQLALRTTGAYAPRLVPRQKKRPDDSAAVALEMGRPGTLGELQWRSTVPRAPQQQEVAVRVDLLLLNFRDAVRAMGLEIPQDLQEHAATPVPLGVEWIGHVQAVGQDVTELVPGDRVVGLAPAGGASAVTVDQRLTCKLPDWMADEDAAVLPLSYALAWYSLVEVARIRSGERVLVHSAVSTVGLAAIEIAQSIGAEVVATAGNEQRRALLRDRGVSQIYDSRTADFARSIKDTGPVDVVLNSIAGMAARGNLDLLGAGGRLIEIGQRGDVTTNSPKNVSIFHADIVGLALEQPDQYQRVLLSVAEFLARRQHRTIPLRVFSAKEAKSAVRRLVRAVDSGKVAVALDDAREPIWPSACARLTPTTGTILVTGGLGGLGRKVVERFVERGFGDIVIVSRRVPDAATTGWLHEQSRRGSNLRVVQGDVGSRADMERVLANIRSSGPPLSGVVHAAGVLSDGLVDSQTAEDFDTVLTGKARGAWNLHELIDEPLEFFVLFSSVAGLVGTTGQTPYAAANGFLDGLTANRLSRGLPATCIQWGPWDDVGMAASMTAGARPEAPPLHAMDPERCLDILEQLVESWTGLMAVVDADWPLLATSLPSIHALMPGLEQIPSKSELSSVDGAVAEILRCTGDILGTQNVVGSPSDMGMDSMMAVQLSVQLQRALHVPVQAAQILDADSLEKFLDLVLVPLDLDRSQEQSTAPIPATTIPATTVPRNRWLHTLQTHEAPEIKLFCFPFAGVGATTYRDWTFDGAIEAHGVELPGRGNLSGEGLALEMDDLVARLKQHLLPELDGPFAFFGHCMGGLVAYELTRALVADGKTPEHLFVSACPPPDRYAVAQFDPQTLRYVSNPPLGYTGLTDMQQLSQTRFTEVLQFLDFGPARLVIGDDELLQRALPVAQADFGICASYRWCPGEPMDLPITTFVGCEDPFFDMELPGGVRFSIDGWQRQTSAAFESFVRKGDHYFLMEDRAFVQHTIAQRLTQVREATAAG